MIRTLFLITTCIVIISGCSIFHVSSRDRTDDYYPSKRTANEIVYIENIDRSHDIIADIVVNTERRQRLNEVLVKMKREAAILGGDAITNIKTDATGQWKDLPVQEFIGNAYVRANFSCSVAVFK